MKSLKLMSIKSLALTSALGVVGLGLVGAGAHAVFTTASVSAQQITAGTPQVALWSPDAANGCTSLAAAQNNPATCSQTLPMKPVGPVGSTFDSTASRIYMYNSGNIPVTETSIQIGVTPSNVPADIALYNEVYVCLHSWDTQGAPAAGWVEARGPLSAAVALNPSVQENPITIQPGQELWYTMEFYAGQESTCATPNAQYSPQGYSDGPHTDGRWGTQVGHAYVTPPSLNNDAEGGTLATTFTYNYSA